MLLRHALKEDLLGYSFQQLRQRIDFLQALREAKKPIARRLHNRESQLKGESCGCHHSAV